MEKAQLIVGFIRGSHGYSGECKVESASGEYEHLLNLKEVTLQHGNEKKETKVESVSLGCNTAYVKFAGINSDEDIRKYNRWEIVVPRKYCKPLKKDEWYIEDLRNCSLIYEEKGDSASLNAPAQVVGTITDVLEGGAGYLLLFSSISANPPSTLIFACAIAEVPTARSAPVIIARFDCDVGGSSCFFFEPREIGL